MNTVICEECETVQHCIINGCIPKVQMHAEQQTYKICKSPHAGKAVVYYDGKPEFLFWNNDLTKPIARLPMIYGHPKLGHCADVRTSLIKELLRDGTICTMNTIYKPVA